MCVRSVNGVETGLTCATSTSKTWRFASPAGWLSCMVMFVPNGNEDTNTVPVGPVMLMVGGMLGDCCAKTAVAISRQKMDTVMLFFRILFFTFLSSIVSEIDARSF